MSNHPFFDIFPNGDIQRFGELLRKNNKDVEFSLYCYGLFTWEFDKYRKEINAIKKLV